MGWPYDYPFDFSCATWKPKGNHGDAALGHDIVLRYKEPKIRETWLDGLVGDRSLQGRDTLLQQAHNILSNLVDENLPLIWTSPEVTRQISEIAKEVERPERIRDLCLPGPDGMIWFGESLKNADGSGAITALSWSLISVVDDYGSDTDSFGDLLFVTAWIVTESILNLEWQHQHGYQEDIELDWALKAAGDVLPFEFQALGDNGLGDADPRLQIFEDVWAEDTNDWCRLVIAVAAWCAGNAEVAEEPVYTGRPERRRAQRSGLNPDRRVNVIKMRQLEGTGDANSKTTGNGSPLKNRHAVRGHMRNQPYGPGRSRRRQIWIAPYVKGPQEAPLVKVQKLWNLDR